MRGYVKKVVLDRGFLFVHQHDGEDVFAHCTGLCDGLEFNEQLEGREVLFDETADRSGRRKAINVRAAN